VVIGRNEGERLLRCLRSAEGLGMRVVYVDSGSTDGSVAAARRLGAEVVELDSTVPFTAARARNAGLERLRRIDPTVELVQFVDGDCELAPGWLERASSELRGDPRLAVVFGRLRERHPERSIYNRLGDLEWDGPPGEARYCGGNAMMRVAAVVGTGGFDPSLIAGEEPDLCVRLRGAGWGVRRIDAEMGLHDLAMTRFGQWWRRAVRSGYAFAEGSARHGAPPERHWAREARSSRLWGAALPAAIIGLAWPTRGASLALLAGYPVLGYRVYRWGRRQGWPPAHARLCAAFLILAKFPEALGQARYFLVRALGASARIIEYKGQPGHVAAADAAGADATL
jgi:glycosyltransferase involved in cell wall biosynthesis